MLGHKDSCSLSPFLPSPRYFLLSLSGLQACWQLYEYRGKAEREPMYARSISYVVTVCTVHASVTLKVTDESLHGVIPSIPFHI